MARKNENKRKGGAKKRGREARHPSHVRYNLLNRYIENKRKRMARNGASKEAIAAVTHKRQPKAQPATTRLPR